MRRVLLIITLAALIADFVGNAVASRYRSADVPIEALKQSTMSIDGLLVAVLLKERALAREAAALP